MILLTEMESNLGAEELALKLRAPDALEEDLGLVPSNLMKAHDCL